MRDGVPVRFRECMMQNRGNKTMQNWLEKRFDEDFKEAKLIWESRVAEIPWWKQFSQYVLRKRKIW
jgi:hypothetical protein